MSIVRNAASILILSTIGFACKQRSYNDSGKTKSSSASKGGSGALKDAIVACATSKLGSATSLQGSDSKGSMDRDQVVSSVSSFLAASVSLWATESSLEEKAETGCTVFVTALAELGSAKWTQIAQEASSLESVATADLPGLSAIFLNLSEATPGDRLLAKTMLSTNKRETILKNARSTATSTGEMLSAVMGRITESATKWKWSDSQVQSFVAVYKKAPLGKIEVDAVADGIKASTGALFVAKAPLKSPERAIEKIQMDYAGDSGRIKDLVRNTIIAENHKIDAVRNELAMRGAQLKIIDGNADPMGYSGTNSTIVTQVGTTAEVQINSPEMIYAKETEANARVVLGESLYQSIADKVKIKGGQGHELYEIWRSLPETSPKRSDLEAQSKAYYDSVRKAATGGTR